MSGAEHIDGGSGPAISRRKVLLGAGGAAGLAFAAAFVPLVFRSKYDLVRLRLFGAIPDIDIRPDQLDRFARDFIDYYRLRNPGDRDLVLIAARMLEPFPSDVRLILPEFMLTPLQRFDRELFRAFFLGTDFLEARQQPGREVVYHQMPDPYIAGCANNLAQFA